MSTCFGEHKYMSPPPGTEIYGRAAITLREVKTYITITEHFQNCCSENIYFALLTRASTIKPHLQRKHEPLATCRSFMSATHNTKLQTYTERQAGERERERERERQGEREGRLQETFSEVTYSFRPNAEKLF